MMSLLILSGASSAGWTRGRTRGCDGDKYRIKACGDVKGDRAADDCPPTNQGLPEEDSLVTHCQTAGPQPQMLASVESAHARDPTWRLRPPTSRGP